MTSKRCGIKISNDLRNQCARMQREPKRQILFQVRHELHDECFQKSVIPRRPLLWQRLLKPLAQHANQHELCRVHVRLYEHQRVVEALFNVTHQGFRVQILRALDSIYLHLPFKRLGHGRVRMCQRQHFLQITFQFRFDHSSRICV